MDPEVFLKAFVEAHGAVVDAHNNHAATPEGHALGLISLPKMNLDDARKLFCTDFPKAFSAYQKFSGFLRMWPPISAEVAMLGAVLMAVHTSIEPAICAVPAATTTAGAATASHSP